MTSRRPTVGPWPVIGVSAAVTGLGAGPGFLFGLVGPALQADLGLSLGSLGLLIGLFFGGCGVTSAVAGRWGARLGARNSLVLDMAVMATSMVAVAIFQVYAVLAAAAVASGLAYAFGNVGTTMAVVHAARPGTVGLALTVKTAGVPLVAALLAFGSGATGSEWQWLAWSLAGAGLVVGLLALRVMPPVAVTGVTRSTEPPLPRQFWLLPVAAFLFIGGSQPLLSWTVTYLHDEGRLTVSQAGPIAAVGTLLGMGAMILVARWADRAGAGRRAVLVAGVSAVAAAGILVTVLGTPWWLPLGLSGVVLGIAANLTGAGLIHTVTAERSPDSIGRGSGMMLSGYYIGALVAPWGFGVMADLTGGYLVPWVACAAMLLLSSAGFLRVQVALPVRSVRPGLDVIPGAAAGWRSRTAGRAARPRE